MGRPVAGGPSSGAALAYLRKAVADTTRKSYDTAVARFRQWRADQGQLPDELPTVNELLSWIADMADRGQLAASTIKAYTSAVGEWFLQHANPDGGQPNPAGAAVVRRVLDGVARVQAERRQGRPLTAEANPLLYTTLQRLGYADTPSDRMRRAAAFLGVAGGFRPGELLASKAGRPLLREQMQFFANDAATVRMEPPGNGGLPRVLEVTLRATKTVQLDCTIKYIRASDAVQACWRWLCETAVRGPKAVVFQLEAGGATLTPYALAQDLNRRHAAAGLGPASFTGKSLRQGGASTLAVMGVEEEAIAALGWAPGSNMWKHYVRGDPQAVRQMNLQRSAHMQPERPPSPQSGPMRRDPAVLGRG